MDEEPLTDLPEEENPSSERKKVRRGQKKAQARLRAVECVRGVLAGLTYQEVADQLGYANRGTVHRIVQQALDRHEAQTLKELRELELARLDGLQAAFYASAEGGDLRAGEFVLKVMAHRCRLLRLDREEGSELDDSRVLIVGGTKEAFIAALQSGRNQGRSSESTTE